MVGDAEIERLLRCFLQTEESRLIEFERTRVDDV